MATQPAFEPDTITPQSPPEAPIPELPMDTPMPDAPDVTTPSPDRDLPDLDPGAVPPPGNV